MLLATVLTALLSAQAEPDLSWMSGYWLSCADGEEVSETWSDPRGGLMVAHGVTLARGRVSFEMLRVGPHEGGLAYFAQPGGRAATIFLAIEVAPNRVVFANPKHDFPQRIIYARTGDVMTARIEGEINGRAEAMEWRYERAELNARCPAV